MMFAKRFVNPCMYKTYTQVIEVNDLPYFNIGITCNPV